MTKIQSVVRGVGGYLPERIITNEEMSTLVDTTDEWIVQRTGITQRHVAAEGEFTSDLALKAAQSALDNAGLTANDIDLIIIGTTTPDQTFPSTAAILQQKLGISHGFAFDIQAVCSGFVFALTTADTYLKTGMAKRALVIGAETTTRLLDWSDRTTCVLFGDGAGAIILEAQDFSEAEEGFGILASSLRTDGSHWRKLYVDGGVSSTGSVGHLRMEGKEVFKHAVGMITDVIYDVLEKTGKDINDLTWFAPHQANKRIIDGAGKKLGIPDEKTIITVDKHANTSAASVPLALWVASQDGRIQKGDLVLLEAMGGGFTWGATLIRW